MAKRFINKPEHVVPELMYGLALDGSRVTLVEPYSDHYIGIRTDLVNGSQPARVSVVSGGGSGHEPMALGYIGDGILAAAVAGKTFAAPTVPAIQTMLEATAQYSTGIVVVIMNYQGDRQNFGIAIDNVKKKFSHFPIDKVIVGDDCALPDNPQKRGIAGTAFVLKVAGSAADSDCDFPQVFNLAKNAAHSIASFGVALEPCTLPGNPVDTERLGSHEIELGMGIHGEPGVSRLPLDTFRGPHFNHDLISAMCERINTSLEQKTEAVKDCNALAIMVNNLGAVPKSEMSIAAKAIGDYLFEGNGSVMNGKLPVYMFNDSYITSLQMIGISITCLLLPKSEPIEQYLNKPTSLSSWTAGFKVTPPSQLQILVLTQSHEAEAPTLQITKPSGFQTVLASTQSESGQRAYGIDSITENLNHNDNDKIESGLSTSTEKIIMTITNALLQRSDELGILDGKTGDGDFGLTVKSGSSSLQQALRAGEFASFAGSPDKLFRSIGEVLGKSMGGTIGGFTAIFFEAAAKHLEYLSNHFGPDNSTTGTNTYDPSLSWRLAFVEGTKAVMSKGGANVGDRTLVDALKPAADVLADPEASIEAAAAAAKQGCDATKTMGVSKFGRSAHVREEMLLNYHDPGALAVSIILDAIVSANPA